MRVRIPALVAVSLILVPATASAQYYGSDFDRRGRDVHVDRYHFSRSLERPCGCR